MDEDDLPLGDIVGVVLAGGLSRRMGRNKLLMEIAGRPMIRHVVETVRGSVKRVIVASGYQPERIAEALARLPVEIVPTDPEAGIDAAVHAAFAHIDPALPTLLCIGDQPRLTEREILGLVAAYRAGDPSRILVPVREGQRGYPLIVPPGFRPETLDLSAPDLVTAHPDRCAAFITRNPVYGSSIDTLEDYRALFSIRRRGQDG